MTRTDLLALAARVEREEPSEELRCAVLVAFGWEIVRDDSQIFSRRNTPSEWQWSIAPDPLHSIDAAASLMPPGIVWTLYSGSDTYVASAACGPKPEPGRLMEERWGAEGATEAAALTAAALRAIAMEARDE
jgi:hypothetical protein